MNQHQHERTTTGRRGHGIECADIDKGSPVTMLELNSFREYVEAELQRVARELRSSHPADAALASASVGMATTKDGTRQAWDRLNELRSRHPQVRDTRGESQSLQRLSLAQKFQQLAELP